MKHLLFSLLLAFPVLASAQDLHTFSNGEVADAEKINENFQYVLENATGSGCSVEQVDNTAEVSCADGSTAVLAGNGTVIVYPGSIVYEPETTVIATGDIVVKDANNVILGKVSRTENGGEPVLNLGTDEYPAVATVWNNEDQTEVFIGAYFSMDSVKTIYYLEPRCEGNGFAEGGGRAYLQKREDLNEFYYVVRDQPVEGSILTASKYEATYLYNQTERGVAACEDKQEVINTLYPIALLSLPEEILSATYPLTIEQLP